MSLDLCNKTYDIFAKLLINDSDQFQPHWFANRDLSLEYFSGTSKFGCAF